MKKVKPIFLFIFLAGMLFTVFQYMPILEEETPSHRLELAKKLKQDNDLEGDGDADDDGDPDTKADINYYSATSFIFVLNYKRGFPDKNKSWPHRAKTINTPPPQI